MAVSEFQLALIGAGAVAVIAVWAYNIWQEYRYRKAAQRIFSSQQEDVLIADAVSTSRENQETLLPRSSGTIEASQPERVVADRGDRIEPVIGTPPNAGDFPAEPAAAASALPDEEWLDPMIELGLSLPPDLNVSHLLDKWRQQGLEFSKRMRFVRRDAAQGEWVDLLLPGDESMQADYVAIQLADRQGAVSKAELDGFCTTIALLANESEVPSVEEVFAQARNLDDSCAAVDIQIAIHVVSLTGREFPGTKLKGLLEAAGLQLAADGLFYLLDVAGQRLVSVSNSGAVPFDVEQMRTGTTPDVTFWLDVPRVAEGGRVFDLMVATARQLAGALDGVLVDDQHKSLTDDMLSGIRAKVIELQAQMAAQGIPAGGRRALRLFA
jgi:FtsZ-interacting cell division protein ZipA